MIKLHGGRRVLIPTALFLATVAVCVGVLASRTQRAAREAQEAALTDEQKRLADDYHKSRQCCGEMQGEIRGRVIDGRGNPVSGAAVYADVEGAATGMRPGDISDSEGAYRILAQPRTYSIYASKKESGHPDSSQAAYFFGGNPVHPQITVVDQEIAYAADVVLLPKAPTLDVLVVDAATKQPIPEVRLTVARADNPDVTNIDSTNAKGRLRRLVPAMPFTVEAVKEGYAPASTGPFEVKEGVKKLTIALHANQ